MSGRLVIGLGNPDRGDDAAGVRVAGRLRSVAAVESRRGTDVMDLWADADDVVVVDATRSARPPGTVVRIDATSGELPARSFPSSHSFGLAETVELARALERLPGRLTVYGIEGACFEVGAPMSPEVVEAVEAVTAELETG